MFKVPDQGFSAFPSGIFLGALKKVRKPYLGLIMTASFCMLYNSVLELRDSTRKNYSIAWSGNTFIPEL
jgi:hypothetical protein